MVRDSIDISEKMKVLGAGYIPKVDQTNCTANSKGLFAYYRSADAGFVLTTRLADGSGSGWAGITGIKDIRQIDAKALTEVAANKALKSKNPRALEPDRPTGVLHAKAVVVDEEAVFITSANLTEAGLDRNIEMGLLTRDRPLALSVVRHFEVLIGRTLLVPLPAE